MTFAFDQAGGAKLIGLFWNIVAGTGDCDLAERSVSQGAFPVESSFWN